MLYNSDMEKEKNKILAPYKNFEYKNNIPLIVFGNLTVTETKSLFRNLILRDKPDLYSETSNAIWGIEFFEIDNSKTTRKGSTLKKQHEETKNFLLKTSKNNSVINTEKLNVKFSFYDYKKNFYKTFNEHYQKHKVYIDNLVSINQKNKKIYHAYFIEDTTIFGNYIQKGLEMSLILPFHSRNILKFLKRKTDIDYFFFRSVNSYDKTIYIIENSSDVIKYLISAHKDTDFNKYFAFDIEVSFLNSK